MRFAVSGDWHLRPQVWTNRPLYNDTYFGAAQVVAHCLEQRTPLVLTGDQFDTPRPPSGALAFFQECARAMSDLDLPVYALPGNHDACDPEWTDVVPNVTTLKDTRRTLGDVTLLGVGNRPFADLQTALESLDTQGVDALVMHQLLDLACPMEGMHNLKAEWIPDVPLVLMGDLHDPTDLVTPSGSRVVYPGPPVGMNLSEAIRDTGFVWVDSDPSLGIETQETHHRLVVTNRSHSSLDVRDESDVAEFEHFMTQGFCTMARKHADRLIKVFEWLRSVIPSDLPHLAAGIDCEEHLLRPAIQVRFNPDVLSLDRIQKVMDQMGDPFGGRVPRPYLFPVPYRPVSEDTHRIEESLIDNFDPTSPETVRPLVTQLVQAEGLREEAGELLIELIGQGEHPDPEDRRTAISRWRSRFGLEDNQATPQTDSDG